jgi:ABC-type branched-subunit amino acid transport system substrate-binding protein
MKRKIFICMALLLLAVLIFASCGTPATTPTTPSTPSTPSTPAVDKTIKIGALLALTGWWNAAYDNSILRMCEAAVDMINEEGGITVNGEKYKVEFVVEDTQSTFDGVAAAANRLIHEKDINLIVGPTGFYTSAATPVTDPAKAMMITGWHIQMPGEIDATTPYNFGTSQGSLPKDIAIMKSMKRDFPDVKNIVIASPDDGSPPFIMPKIEYYFNELGLNRVGDVILFPNEMEDFSPIVAKILSMSGYDALFVEKAPPPGLAAIVKGVREGGFDGPIFTGSPIDLNMVAMMAGAEATKGVRTTIDTYGDPAAPAVMKEMSQRVADEYGADFPMSFQCAEGIYLFKTLIESANSVDPADLKAEFEKSSQLDTIYGPGPVCGEEFFGIKHIVANPLPIQVWEDGKAAPGGAWIEIGAIP